MAPKESGSSWKVTLGVSAGISIYKACDLVRRLRERGAEVRVVMTKNATRMVSPVTFQALSGNPVISDLFEGSGEPSISHIELAKWEDLLVVAPATADILGKFARGIADDFLSTHYLACTSKVLLVPAMNGAMWRHAAVQENVRILAARGHALLSPGRGSLACGDVDDGRLPEPSEIADAALRLIANKGEMAGLKVLVTAGPTREPLDGVRFISNRSSGKMGYAIAAEAALRGAEVTLVSGPVALEAPFGSERVMTETAEDMEREVRSRFPKCDVLVMAAAVSDYKARKVLPGKRKKDGLTWKPELAAAPDILKGLVPLKRPGQFVCGFAAETSRLKENAIKKLKEKKLDMVAANDVSKAGVGFDSEMNALTLFTPDGAEQRIREGTKASCASALWDAIMEARGGK
ncbi:MAG: bifunctional phosphopantothenoylcysteine decarboxylase/phosphopantothenate--cysteine ligase CoaBC [Acidobacteria bacterium]|nr:bifunctional phosphopantothenoylcysteine decarboxylase/phosphopantothenate--cysteine ligase CoaBC [Acidobacteriota bacterium]